MSFAVVACNWAFSAWTAFPRCASWPVARSEALLRFGYLEFGVELVGGGDGIAVTSFQIGETLVKGFALRLAPAQIGLQCLELLPRQLRLGTGGGERGLEGLQIRLRRRHLKLQ